MNRRRERSIVGQSNKSVKARAESNTAVFTLASGAQCSSQVNAELNSPPKLGFRSAGKVPGLGSWVETPAFDKTNRKKPTSLLHFIGLKSPKVNNQNTNDESTDSHTKSLKLDLSKISRVEEQTFQDLGIGEAAQTSLSLKPVCSSARLAPKRHEKVACTLQGRSTSARVFKDIQEKSAGPEWAKGKPDKQRHKVIDWMEGGPCWDCPSSEKYLSSRSWNLHESAVTRPNPPWASQTHFARMNRIRNHLKVIRAEVHEKDEKLSRLDEARLARRANALKNYNERVLNQAHDVRLRYAGLSLAETLAN